MFCVKSQCFRVSSHGFHRRFHKCRISRNPLELTNYMLDSLHTFTNTSWAVTIPASAIILRSCVTLPVTIYAKERIIRVRSLTALLITWLQVIRKDMIQKIDGVEQFNKSTKKQYANKVEELYRRHNCSPIKTMLLPIIVQTPLFLIVSFTLRGMAGLSLPIFGSSSLSMEPTFAIEGALWFGNLLMPDETFLLPFAIGFLNFVNTEVTSANRDVGVRPTRIKRIVTNSLKILSILTIPIAMQLPSAMSLYWATSALYSLIQNLVLEKIYSQRQKRPFKVYK